MTDTNIIEAAVNALPSFWHPDDKLGTARAVVGAVTPLIRAQVLEEAAKDLAWLAREERNLDGATINRAAEYLDTLRALIPPTPPPFADSA